MPHDFPDGIHVRLHDRVFQASRLADVLAGIHVDGHQCLGLIDHNVATALQPNLGLESLVNLLSQAKLLDQRGLEAVGEAENTFILLLVIDPDRRDVGGDLVAKHALDYVQVVID